VASRGLIKTLWATLAIVAIMPGVALSAERVVLKAWADEGLLIQGKGMGDDVVRLIVEASWDPSAPSDPASRSMCWPTRSATRPRPM
jgi:hypothetical protein